MATVQGLHRIIAFPKANKTLKIIVFHIELKLARNSKFDVPTLKKFKNFYGSPFYVVEYIKNKIRGCPS